MAIDHHLLWRWGNQAVQLSYVVPHMSQFQVRGRRCVFPFIMVHRDSQMVQIVHNNNTGTSESMSNVVGCRMTSGEIHPYQSLTLFSVTTTPASEAENFNCWPYPLQGLTIWEKTTVEGNHFHQWSVNSSTSNPNQQKSHCINCFEKLKISHC